LVDRGLARSRNQAAGLIDAGRVSVAGKLTSKASIDVADEVEITVRPDVDLVGRAGFKLLRGLGEFKDLEIMGKVCLDVGASTGGFTQVLLRAGAEKVVAVDVGHDQLAEELRSDSRVVNLEGFNAREMTLPSLRAATGVEELSIGVVVADLSFISLEKVLPALVETAPAAEMVLLVKPQFEVGRQGVRAGVVSDPESHLKVLNRLFEKAFEFGFGARGLIDSGLPGSHGNVEYLLWISPKSKQNPQEWSQHITNLVGEVL
jgi:23S rRNA (cytidine1920-2'-O)/16S rRNA (cytidine1409-2'-O)-methyltransferase